MRSAYFIQAYIINIDIIIFKKNVFYRFLFINVLSIANESFLSTIKLI